MKRPPHRFRATGAFGAVLAELARTRSTDVEQRNRFIRAEDFEPVRSHFRPRRFRLPSFPHPTTPRTSP